MGLNTCKINLGISGNIEKTGNSLVTVSVPFAYNKSISLAQGTGINAADLIYVPPPLTLTTTPTPVDLAGSLTDPLGNADVFVEVVGIVVYNPSTTPGQKILVGGGSNDFLTWLGATGDEVKVAPGGFLCLVNPEADAYVVTSSTGDLLQLAASSGTITGAELIIIGKSA